MLVSRSLRILKNNVGFRIFSFILSHTGNFYQYIQVTLHALVLTHVDYCNSALAGLSDSALAPLHRVLHTAALSLFLASSRATMSQPHSIGCQCVN